MLFRIVYCLLDFSEAGLSVDSVVCLGFVVALIACLFCVLF